MITLQKHFFALVLMLFCGIACQAANDLITQQITIKLDEAGTLPDKIGSAKKYLITNLKIIGDINGTDIRMLRDMAGCDYKGKSTVGKLSILDLSEANIVKGGDYYLYLGYDYYYIKENNVLNDYAFLDCNVLTSLAISSSVTNIGKGAFWNCYSLKTVKYYINEDLTTYLQTGHPDFEMSTTFEVKYFLNNQEITNLTIPSSVTQIVNNAFENCSDLMSLTIPSSIISIGSHAFFGCSGLTSLTLPSSITSIGSYTFYGCSGLTSLTLPSSITSIGSDAFCGCSGLTSLTLPSSITSIGSDAFKYCSGLTSLTLPSSITSIGSDAFKYCSGLTSISVYWETPLKIGSSVFEDVDKQKCTLYVPQGTYQDYWLAEGWGNFENIVEFDAAGIKGTTTSPNTKEVSRYSVNGQRLSSPAKGMNVVKYSDGNVKKIVTQ